ncbi:5'-methylthioadenosine/S-adenosylhomocysteine nucleosidase family protein [Burkholderia sp. MSMB1835]|uniref:5'-methylthioadenosine/S-adenosylhomocysteine nucleosidase family protein n=1 Tax=Burkholderia sp. MSMB1835 TaxID=1637876 RepID=UPI0015D07AB2|nr:hypothetical protein [Burkholderia sp. MSMB1835]
MQTADIVLLTVNKHEQEQLKSALERQLDRKLIVKQGASNEVYLDAGDINGQRVVIAKSLIGSTGSGASFDTVTNVVEDLAPQVIIAVGIAWGAKNADGQKIGDILISTRLRDAQHNKITQEGIALRGTIEAVDGTLLKIFSAGAEGLRVPTHEGLLVSIETLFDNEQQRDMFIAADQHQAIGGEMEGSGLLMALRRATECKVNWLIVKAICDWGFKKNANPEEKERDQKMAARNAADLCAYTIHNFRLISSKRQGQLSRVNDISSNSIKAVDFEPAVQVTPPERSIAKTVQAYISKNSSFSLDVGFPVKHRDWSEKIIFELYKLTEELGGGRYFLYVHEAASQNKTLIHLSGRGLINNVFLSSFLRKSLWPSRKAIGAKRI